MNPTIPVTMPPQKHGQSAALIHSLAIIATALVAILGLSLQESNEKFTYMAVGTAATLAFFCWSLLLTFRALRAHETLRCPIFVLGAAMVEASIASVLMWHYQHLLNTMTIPGFKFLIASGIPVILPLFTLATFISVPLAKWSASRKSPAPEPNIVRKRGLITFALSMLLLLTLMLPYPCYFYFLTQAYPNSWSTRPDSSAAHICKMYPLWFRSSAESLLISLGRSGKPEHLSMLMSCQISMPRMEELAADNNGSIAESAIQGIVYSSDDWTMTDSQKGLAYALRVADAKTPLGINNLQFAAWVLAEQGSREDIINYLTSPKTNPKLIAALINSIGIKRRVELLADLEHLLIDNSSHRTSIVTAILRLIPPDELRARWLGFVESSDPTIRDAAIGMIPTYTDEDLAGLVCAALYHKKIGVRRLVLNSNFGFPFAYCTKQKIYRVVKALEERLNDPDIAQRRGAAYWLDFLTNPQNIKAVPTPTGLSKIEDKHTPETDADIAAVEAARQAAQQWLQKNKQAAE